MTSVSKNKFSKRFSGKAAGATALAGALIMAGSMAYFTDRAEVGSTGTAGTVDLTLTESWQDIANFNPGDQADFSYTISNDGNKSIDVRETIVVKSSVPMNAANQAEFELYRAGDVEQLSNGTYAPKDGVEPITAGANRVVSADSTTIKYVIDEYTLNGTGAAAEEESGINATEQNSDYVLVFNGNAGNEFQDAEVSVNLLAEAKQHRNTDADTWVTVATEDLTVGSEAVKAVPSK